MLKLLSGKGTVTYADIDTNSQPPCLVTFYWSCH